MNLLQIFTKPVKKSIDEEARIKELLEGTVELN